MPRDGAASRNRTFRAKMDLLREIRTGRAEKGRKAPFRSALYTRVSGLVRRYGLGDSFLRDLATPLELPREDELSAIRLKRKEPAEPSLFGLSTEDVHRVTVGILSRVTSPYLQYATSPDEILVCESLFRQDPFLDAETLASQHFETSLLAREGTGPK
jgi:hypothetical protein